MWSGQVEKFLLTYPLSYASSTRVTNYSVSAALTNPSVRGVDPVGGLIGGLGALKMSDGSEQCHSFILNAVVG